MTFVLARPPAACQAPPSLIIPRINAPGPNELVVRAASQEAEGPNRRLRGGAELESADFTLRADEIDYNEETGYAEARGNVKFRNLESGEELEADRAEYRLREKTGNFYQMRGRAPVRAAPRQGLLATDNPFVFQGKWAERLKDRYILHDGFVTNCLLPKPWWVLEGPRFDIIPNKRAIAYRPIFRLKRVPLFYVPVFYKSLEEAPRKSGFLTPNIGNSSNRGKMVGLGYYWAVNRSYDLSYRSQYFTQRGFAHHVDVRGKPRAGSDFNAVLYGINDRGLQLPGGQRLKQGGFLVTFDGKAELGRGFSARGEVNYLSSFTFRQAFTESFNEAVFSEIHSVGFVSRHGRGYALNIVFLRNENFQTTQPDDKIVIRKLPSVEFTARDRPLLRRGPPVWVSLESSAGLVRRNQPLFQTRQFVERLDLAPRVMTALRWKDFHLLPAFSLRETHYGSSLLGGRIQGEGVLRSTREFTLDLIAPSLARVFPAPRWLGDKLKHVIEPRAGFRAVDGVGDFRRLIRFDETELISNTREAEISLTQRLFVKRGGVVSELVSWQLWQRRYFDPDFGGALTPGDRNILLSQIELTPYAFLDGRRRYSPVISALRVNPSPRTAIEWRADYDPLRHRITNSGLTADARVGHYLVSVGHNHVRSVPHLSPSANQFRGLLGWGKENLRGWSTAFTAIYDFRLGIMQFATTQVSYNSDCCGFSVQYRRFSFGQRNENQFRVAFVVANIGSFGTLRRQERLF